MQELFVDKIHFPNFLSISDKLQLHQLKIITSTAAVQASVTVRISPALVRGNIKEGRYPVLTTNTKPHQPIKHAKSSYSIVTLVFCKFSWGTYRNGLNRGASKLRHSRYLKKYKPCQFDTSCRESAFQYTLAQGAVLQKFMSQK